jgi:hypothetical protein
VTRQLAIDTRVVDVETILDGEVSLTGFNVPEGLTYDEWVELGRRIHRVENAVMWWWGSW